MHNTTHRLLSLGIGTLAVSAVSAWSATAAAAVVWDQAAVTCQELILATGANDLVTTVNTPGVSGGFAMQDSGTPQAIVTLFCPVWIPSNTNVRAIQIRYVDTSNQGAVRAIFFRQAWTIGGGAATALGSVTSVDSPAIPNVVGSNLPAVVAIDNNQYSYLVRVELYRTSTAAQVRALQVRLLDTPLAGTGTVASDIKGEIDCEKAAASGWKSEEERTVCLGG